MGRKRKPENKLLPDYVYPRKERGCYIYRPHLGGGKLGKPKRLCSIDAPISEIWKAYESLEGHADNTIQWLLDTYNESDESKSHAKSVQKQQIGYRNSLVNAVGAKGGKFGDLPLEVVNRLMIRRYLDVAKFKIGANRHVQYLKAAWNWANQRYPQVPQINPCAGVKLNEEKTRDRYVEEWEFELVQAVINRTTRSPYLSVMMDLAYLCRLRCIEVRNLRESHIEGDYIRIIRSKGSLGELTRISPRLLAAINAAKKMFPNAPVPIKGGPYLLHNAKGQRISKNKFDSAWKRVMEKAVEKGIEIDGVIIKLDEPFHFHDIKGMGITDHPEQWGGHKSEAQRLDYIKKLRVIDATR